MDSHNVGPRGTLFFIGTATTLIRYGELTLLTDPNFLHRGQRAYLGWGLTAKRLTEPASAVGQLPRFDAVLLSHLHGDHWDRNAQRGLDHMIITTPHAAKRLQWRGFSRSLGLGSWAARTWSGVVTGCGSLDAGSARAITGTASVATGDGFHARVRIDRRPTAAAGLPQR